MSKLLKSILLLLILVLLDNNVLCIKSGLFFTNAYAEDVQPPKQKGGEATFPQCGVAAIIGLVAGVVGALVLLASGIASWMGILALAAIVAASMNLIGCLWSFVRNPVLRDDDGNYKYCDDLTPINPADPNSLKICRSQNFQTCSNKSTDDISKDQGGCFYSWPRNKAPYGKHIEVCFREPLGHLCFSGCRARLDEREKDLEKYKPFGKSVDVTPLVDMKGAVGNNLTCKTLKDGESTWIGPYKYNASYEQDKLCVYLTFLGTSKIGCQIRNPSPPTPMCENSVPILDSSNQIIKYDNSKCFNCYISSACYGETGLFSHAQMSMTSMVVQCIKESLDNILIGNCNGNDKVGFLVNAQNKLKNAVQAVILLSIILFGFKLMLGSLQGAHEWGLFVVKVALIIYFTIGDGMLVYYSQLINLSTGLADIVQSAGGNQDICDFKTTEYNYPVVKKNAQLTDNAEKTCYEKILQNGGIHDQSALMTFISANCMNLIDINGFVAKLDFKDFSYLAIWDRLDCRVMFYLGSPLTATSYFVFATPFLGVLIIPFAFLFAGQILIALVALLYMILLILVIIWITHLFILSIIALTIVILFSPIFIPMLLFQVTKNFFDGWLKEVMSYSLYPVILFGFLSLMFSVFDQLFFEDLKFKRKVSSGSSVINNVRNVYTFVLDGDDQCKTDNANGENRGETVLACILDGVGFKNTGLILGIQVTAADTWGSTAKMWQKLGMMALMCFLFYHFLGILGGLAAELVGNFRADMSKHATSPQKMAGMAVAAGIKIGKAIATSGASLKDDVAKEAKRKGAELGEKTDGGSKQDEGITSAIKDEVGSAAGGAAGGGAGSGAGGAGGAGGGAGGGV